MLRCEDKRLEIQAMLNQIDYNDAGGVDESEVRMALKLCNGGDEPAKKDVEYFVNQLGYMIWHTGNDFTTRMLHTRASLEHLLLSKFAKSPSKQDLMGIPPWSTLAQIRHAELVTLPKESADENTFGEDNLSNNDFGSPVQVMWQSLSTTSYSDDHFRSSANTKCLCTSDENGDSSLQGGDDESSTKMKATIEDLIEIVIDPASNSILSETTELPSTISEDPTTSNDKVATNEVGFTTVVEEVPLNTDAINLLVEEANGESCCIDKESVVAEVKVHLEQRTVVKLQHKSLQAGEALDSTFDYIQFGNVVALILSDNCLTSMECFQLINPLHVLRVLDLSKNQLTNISPAHSLGIRNLEVLDLSHNQFKEISGIEHLTKLRALSYAGNSIRTIKNLEKLEYLEILNVSSNQIMVAQSLRMLRMNKVSKR
ncbi:hypothetical protein AeRB84_010376 [Aphanomyces euteiches]|nr:hypothetical protein AeRB84_010376 [Aphanomyces euteiches]